jgi:hypothetical protein
MKSLGYHLTYSVLVVSLAWSTGLLAQEKTIECERVPRAVRAAFEKAFPRAAIDSCATEVEDGKTVFEVASKEGKIGRDVLYHPDGTVIVVEETMPVNEMPGPVQQAVRSKFPSNNIARSEKVMRGGEVLYEFQVRHRGNLAEVQFDPHGNEVPKEP